MLITAACCLVFSGVNFYYIIFAASMHELVHFAAAALCGYKPKFFILRGFGIEMNNLRGRVTTGELAFISASGPMMNIFLAFLGYKLGKTDFFIINISTAAINFLPVFPLDGGQILYSLLLGVTDRKKARLVLDVLSKLTGGIMIFTGVCLLAGTGYNFSLLYIGVVVFMSSAKYMYNPIIELSAYENKDIYKSGVFVINGNVNDIKTANLLPANAIGAVKNENGEITKLVTPHGILKEISKRH